MNEVVCTLGVALRAAAGGADTVALLLEVPVFCVRTVRLPARRVKYWQSSGSTRLRATLPPMEPRILSRPAFWSPGLLYLLHCFRS